MLSQPPVMADGCRHPDNAHASDCSEMFALAEEPPFDLASPSVANPAALTCCSGNVFASGCASLPGSEFEDVSIIVDGLAPTDEEWIISNRAMLMPSDCR